MTHCGILPSRKTEFRNSFFSNHLPVPGSWCRPAGHSRIDLRHRANPQSGSCCHHLRWNHWSYVPGRGRSRCLFCSGLQSQPDQTALCSRLNSPICHGCSIYKNKTKHAYLIIRLSAKKECALSAHSFFVNMNKIDNFCNRRNPPGKNIKRIQG